MKKLRLFGAVYTCATALVLSASANAAIISADWQASDDGLITQYTTNGLEWLDLTVTVNRIYNDVYAEVRRAVNFMVADMQPPRSFWTLSMNLTDPVARYLR